MLSFSQAHYWPSAKPIRGWMAWLMLLLLVACSTPPREPIREVTPPTTTLLPAKKSSGALAGMPGTPSPQNSFKSRWVEADWRDLPGWDQDNLQDAWNAWLQNCERPGPLFAPLCRDVRQLILSNDDDRRMWMMAHLRPWRIESVQGQDVGLLTSYYEPIFDACDQPCSDRAVALYAPPVELAQGRQSGQGGWTRKDFETLPEAQQALRGHELAWLADPLDALILHIQGSGLLRLTQKDGTVVVKRMSFAASNEQPYQSVGRWLLDRGYIKDASWAGIRAWVNEQQATHPALVQEMFWSNPRYVFFRPDLADLSLGPKGAQGVPLTAGRSVAVDKDSIAYATPLWMASSGAGGELQRLVFAQDTGSAIVGAVRADYFAGTGKEAGEFAGQVKQNLRLWALWPK